MLVVCCLAPLVSKSWPARTLRRSIPRPLEQLLTAPSVEACAQLLSEWGYAPVHDEPSLQAALSAQREAVFADVSRFMPEAEVLDVFRLKYDYHNIKTLLKAPQNNCFFWAACRRPFLCGGAQWLNG